MNPKTKSERKQYSVQNTVPLLKYTQKAHQLLECPVIELLCKKIEESHQLLYNCHRNTSVLKPIFAKTKGYASFIKDLYNLKAKKSDYLFIKESSVRITQVIDTLIYHDM